MIGRFPEGIDHALIHLTGTIVTWWGRVEGVLVHELLTLRRLYPEFSAKEQFPVQSGNIIAQWGRLQRKHFSKDSQRLQKIEKLLEDMRELSDDRNTLAHYFWPYGGTQGKTEITLQTIKPRRGDNATLEIKTAVISVRRLDEINERLMSLYHTVMADSLNLHFKLAAPKGDTASR